MHWGKGEIGGGWSKPLGSNTFPHAIPTPSPFLPSTSSSLSSLGPGRLRWIVSSSYKKKCVARPRNVGALRNVHVETTPIR